MKVLAFSFSFILSFLFFIGVFVWSWNNIEKLSQLATLVTSFSVILLIIEYSTKAKKDRKLNSFEQVSMFRKEIIPLVNNFTSLVEKDSPDYVFSRVKLNVSDIAEAIRNQPIESKKQADLITGNKNKKMYNSQVGILNAVEELSIKILQLKIQDHEILTSIKNSFIYSLEICAVSLLIQKQIFPESGIYNNSLKLYQKWERSFGNRSETDKLNSLFKK